MKRLHQIQTEQKKPIGHSQKIFWPKGPISWPKGPISWTKNRILYVSIPFTWNLRETKKILRNPGLFWDRAIVGGPSLCLMPEYFDDLPHVKWSKYKHGVLQKINPLATRTTIGCPNHCSFCGIDKIEPCFSELDDWPNLPIVCDNNLLASSVRHFDKVIDRLIKWGWADFNQGLDVKLLTKYHAKRIAEIKKPMIRLALDSMAIVKPWEKAIEKLFSAGIAKSHIRSYVLIGFDSPPVEAWMRCKFIENHGIKPLPMWFHELNAMEKNIITKKQKDFGWNDEERKKIMQWFYQHRKYPRNKDVQKTSKGY